MLSAGGWSSAGLRAAGIAGKGKEGNFCYFTSKCVMKYDGLSQKVSLTIEYAACYSSSFEEEEKVIFRSSNPHLPGEEGQTT